MQNSEAGDIGASAAAPSSHPLLDELRGKLATYLQIVEKKLRFRSLASLTLDLSPAGLLRRLQGSSQPINDGHEHVVLLCETVEAIYRKGLKSKRPYLM